MGIVSGNTYDPVNNLTFVQLSGFALLDYQKVWGHMAPRLLWFKVEASLGGTTKPDGKLVAAANMFAVYYLEGLFHKTLRPYAEGGIGLIYTDFQVAGQGLRLNFNPQVGIGTEFRAGSGTTLFTALRLHHISNGGLDRENRGVNSVILLFGSFL